MEQNLFHDKSGNVFMKKKCDARRARPASGMWTIVSLPERLKKQKKDPWAEFKSTRQIITRTMMQRLGIK